MSDAPAIVTEGLTKHYGDVRALENLDLTIGQGEIFGFLGPNGAGKTTTMRTILDLIRPTAGTARIMRTRSRFANTSDTYPAIWRSTSDSPDGSFFSILPIFVAGWIGHMLKNWLSASRATSAARSASTRQATAKRSD